MFSNLILLAAGGLISLVVTVGAVAAGERDQLSTLAQQAAAHLATSQQPGGYWLTAHTPSTKFEHPQFEMNVFVTSMIVDLLEPVEAKAGLSPSIARARAHLSAQIEENGLVRYHGRRDSPTILALGRVITPDADDTALVWRLAGDAKSPLLPGVLEILRSYRTAAGLYHTWLAPRTEYINIDPGKDPNPADIGIQMHVLMFLAKFDPAAAAALYPALQRAIGDEQHWVYYRLAPLLALLREADLRRLGYTLHLPANFTRSPFSGQADWEMSCRLLAPYLAAEKSSKTPEEIADFLRKIAADDFAAIRREPPLFFHNDLTGHISRYYWSEDFGYALWLRLYLEAMTIETSPSGRNS